MIGTCFLLHLDGTDDLGRFDQFMRPYYEQSLAAGEITPEEAREWIRELWGKIDRAGGWNVAIGGLKADGSSAVSDFTRLCIEAAAGRRRPNLALRIPPDMPDDVWEATFDCLASGGGLPALYNEMGYRRAIREAHLNLSEVDLADFAFGGCTELMVHGKSNVGSLEGDLNLPLVMVDSLHARLPDCPTFEDFLAGLKQDFAAYIRRNVEQWNRNQASKAVHHPLPMRSLLIDDCIENGREYNAGGARYNWCIVNVMGLANVADSLAALKQVVYEEGAATREELLAALRDDFAGHEALQRRLKSAPHFGNDDPYVDEIMREVSTFVFEELRKYAPWRGGRYLGSCLMFVTYAGYGKPVGATPDGRHAGMPIADSAGAMQGRDISGPTALLQSATKIPHWLAPGTLVTNIRLSPKFFRGEGRRKLCDLLLTYFRLGGMQLQMTVVDQATLQAAMKDPEKYGDLIIRVGGYSEYWSRLDDDLRRSILERVEHE
jgi:formate C-acetyltransferase